MGNSKIIYGDTVLMDLTSDTVTADKLLKGETAHGADGEPITGTYEGGGSSSPILYDMGNFFGTSEGSTVNTLTISLSGHIGNKAILCVMHRDDITLSGWSLIAKKANPSNSTYSITQFISVFEKLVSNESESYTISQSSSARICACVFYVESDVSITFDETIDISQTSRYYHYDIGAYKYDTLCVLSDVYAGSHSGYITPTIAINCSSELRTANIKRMLAFINPSITQVVLDINTDNDEPSKFYNKVFVFKLAKPSSGDSASPFFYDSEGKICFDYDKFDYDSLEVN